MMMMDTQTSRAKKLVKLLERLIKQEHLYNDDELKEIKNQLKLVKKEICDIEVKTFKGFGKK